MSGAPNELDVGVESERMSQTSARRGIAFPRSGLNVSVVYIVERDLIRLRPDDSVKRPVRLSSGGDPHNVAVWGGTANYRPLPDCAFFVFYVFWFLVLSGEREFIIVVFQIRIISREIIEII